MNSAARNTWMYSCLFFCFLAVAVPVQAAPVPVDGKYAVDYTQIVTIIKQTSGLRARVIALYLKLTHRERYTEDQIASLERKARLLCRTVKRFMETRRVGNRRRLVQASQARLNAAYRKLMSLLGEDPSSAPSGMHLISQEKPSGSMFPTASHDRPISVMVENHAKARPQTGLDKADIVYEVLVEGGITRFMAVYFDKAGVIGPVRSCRDYFVDRSQEYDAFYIHCGSSPAGLKRLKLLQVDHLDEISSRRAFWRDDKRRAPHNLYTGTKRLVAEIKRRTLRTETSWGSKGPSRRHSNLPGIKKLVYDKNKISSLVIKYHPNYIVGYGLDTAAGLYLRFINEKAHNDAVTGKQLSTPNLVLQVVDNKVVDKDGRLAMEFSGKGPATCIVGGTVISGTWEKPNAVSATRFLDKTGNDIMFLKGPIWIQVVPGRASVVLGDEPAGKIMTVLPVVNGRL